MKFNNSISLNPNSFIDVSVTNINIRMLSIFIAAFFLVTGFITAIQSTKTNYIQEKHCGCGNDCLCENTCGCS